MLKNPEPERACAPARVDRRPLYGLAPSIIRAAALTSTTLRACGYPGLRIRGYQRLLVRGRGVRRTPPEPYWTGSSPRLVQSPGGLR